MVVTSANNNQTYAGGQMTDLPAYPGGFDATALLEVVSPGNVEEGINYGITMDQLALIIGPLFIYPTPTIILSGATYNSVATDVRILVDKTVGSATGIVLLGGVNYTQPILVKDLKGDADTHPITVTFTGGELMDGQSSVVIDTPYGFFWFNPLAAGGFYATT